MTETDQTAHKPRIALMGEFSAGKSTLANLLLGQEVSRVQVTATQLPPVHYRAGCAQAQRLDLEGEQHPLPSGDWSGISPDNTQAVEVQVEAPFLETCDLIDMPGTSDPNMAPDHWERLLPEVDMVIWCTPAAQAWRQSEAALWELVPPKLWDNSILLITRMDKLQSDRDRARVLLRVRRETEGLFRDVLPISLLAALEAQPQDPAFQTSGATALMQGIGSVLESLQKHAVSLSRPKAFVAVEPEAEPEAALPRVMPRRVARRATGPLRARPEARAH